MAGLPPGDPQLVSLIVSHLKTQGLFDQFRRDCLADVDTKPAYLNLKQRVDNFVSNHLSNHTWSPHLNKNQLRNNIRQLVLQSGMLEQGVDRIVAQVVDPKVNHTFRPQVERVVREFLSPGSCSEEPQAPLPLAETKPDSCIPDQASSSAATVTSASDAMSILDTITSLNQEASVRASSDTDKGRKGQDLNEPMELVEQSEQGIVALEEGEIHLQDAEEAKMTSEVQAFEVKTEDAEEQMDLGKEGFIEEVKMEEEESAAPDQKEEEKEKAISKTSGQHLEEKQDDDQQKSTSQAKQKARERIKEEYSLEDSDLDGLSDITVSSVHTSDLSSFEGESDNEELLSESSEEGELPSDDQDEGAKLQCASGDAVEDDKDCKPRRKAYVHKPFLYSRYYSDSDDEITVEERRRSAAKDKEERLLKRQQNRERMEEKRKQKVAQAEEQDSKKQKSADLAGLEGPRAKEARKERKVLEKKMALSRKRKLDSRKEGDVPNKKKGDTGGEGVKKVEMKLITSKTPQPKLIRNLSESASSDERQRKMSSSISEDSSETKKLCDKGRTHSFILELEQGSQEALRQRAVGKFDRLSRKELHVKERKEKEGSLSCERAKPKQKQEKKSEHQTDECQQKEGVKVLPEEKGEKKPKIKSEKKIMGNSREGKTSVPDGVPDEGPKDAKKVKPSSTGTAKAEKDKIREKEKDKDKSKEKEKVKVEKTAKRDLKQLQRPDSAGSSEDRSDLEPGTDGSKKKEKHSKEVLKRSKSHSEDSQGEKPKSKTDVKEVEKEKTKADQDGQKSNKTTCETDKDPKRVKPTEKGKTVDKTKSKEPKEEIKTALSSKADKTVQSLENRNAGVASVSKVEATKEKKKEGVAKEHRKISEELSQEKSEIKSAKRKLEKDKVPEKKDDNQEEKKSIREEKTEKSDKSSNSSVASLSLDIKEPHLKQCLLQDTSTDSDPVTTTVTASFSDDTCDALSDITPEPPESETESRLGEMPAVPAEADALLTLVDVCTSAEARLPPESIREDVAAEMALQDADMKMKEAALTLLSMDPDSTMSSNLISQDTRDEHEVNPSTPQPVETIVAEDVQHLPMEVQSTAETGFTATEALPAAPQHVVELVEENLYNEDESEKTEKEMVKLRVDTSKTCAPQEDGTTSNVCQVSLKEHEDNTEEVPPETRLNDDFSPPTADKDEVRQATGKEAVSAVSSTTEQDSTSTEMLSEKEQAEPDVSDTKTSPKTEVEDEENQASMDTVDTLGEAESKKVEEEDAEKSDSQMMEVDLLDKSEEIGEDGPEHQPELLPHISDEKNGNGKESKEQPSAEEAEHVKEDESSVTPEEVEMHQPEDAEKLDEGHRETHSDAPLKEATTVPVDNNKDEREDAEVGDTTPSGKPAETQKRTEEESAPEESACQKSQDTLMLTPDPEDSEPAESSDSKETADTRKPAVKRKRSEEESVEQTKDDKEFNEADSQQDQSEQTPEKDMSSFSSANPSGEQEVKEESCSQKKPEDTEEEQQREDPETTPKKIPRRGRPPKAAAAAADSDKKDKKTEEKKSEKNNDEEEEEDDEEKEGDGKEAATRATTRSASRLEAEKNKPSKPSTRASRQSGKEEAAAGTRGTRGQAAAAAAAAKGGRKREASPPAVRTRAGQKSEEPPSKRAKR